MLFRSEETALNDRAIRSFWLTHAIAPSGDQRQGFLFIPTDVSEDETEFWTALLDQVCSEGRRVDFISVTGGAEDPVRGLAEHPAVSEYGSQLEDFSDDAGKVVFVRMAKTPTVDEVTQLKQFDTYFLMNSPSVAARSETRHRSEIMRKLLGPAYGLLIVDQEAENTLPRALKWLELLVLNLLANRRPKKEEA